MQSLTPAERRGALLVLVLLALGSLHDLWRATRPLPAAAPSGIDPAGSAPATDSTYPADRTVQTVPEPASPAAGVPIDLNRASAHELDALPGIGPVLAARIVEHREREGRFRRPEELLVVRGIGPRLFARLRPLVTAGPPMPRGRDPGRAPPPRDSSLYRERRP